MDQLGDQVEGFVDRAIDLIRQYSNALKEAAAAESMLGNGNGKKNAGDNNKPVEKDFWKDTKAGTIISDVIAKSKQQENWYRNNLPNSITNPFPNGVSGVSGTKIAGKIVDDIAKGKRAPLATGAKYVSSSGIYNVDDGNGPEIIARRGRYTRLEVGDGVVPADLTARLFALAKSPEEYIMASSIVSKLNLPNAPGGQNKNNLVSEYDEYVKLYKNWNRTTTGQWTIGPLASSGNTYTTKDYPEDADVYNRGQEGMISLLYKYVLKNYLIDADALKELSSATNSAVETAEDAASSVRDVLSSIGAMGIVYDVLVENASGTYTVTSGLPSTLPARIFDIRFIAPANSIAGNSLKLVAEGSVIPIKMINGKAVPANIWAKGSVVQLSINNTGTTPTATLSGGGGSSGHLVSATAPDDTSVLWIDSANGYFAKIWDGSKWVGISAAWG